VEVGRNFRRRRARCIVAAMSYSSELQAKRAAVIRGAATGVLTFLLLLVALYMFLPPPELVISPLDRLFLALRCDAIAALTLMAGIQAVASQRGQSDAINPLAGKDPPSMQVHSRYIQNTLEQLVLFVVGTAALSTYLDAHTARILPALTVVFVVARLAFWRGYLRDPMARSLGMAGTFVVNFAVFAAVIYFTVRTGLGL
jgi:uncharacterized MAPEG superfamily protein